MEERKYTFYDRYQKVKYANITAEELEVLNIFYNKEHYMFDQQHQRNNTVLFCGLESENGCATDFIADSGRDIASDITTEIFFKELFSDLTEKEKKIVSDYFIMGIKILTEACVNTHPQHQSVYNSTLYITDYPKKSGSSLFNKTAPIWRKQSR